MKQDKMNDSKKTPNKAGNKKGGSAGAESRGGQRGALAARDEKKNTRDRTGIPPLPPKQRLMQVSAH